MDAYLLDWISLASAVNVLACPHRVVRYES
jgi:hypothetical protein